MIQVGDLFVIPGDEDAMGKRFRPGLRRLIVLRTWEGKLRCRFEHINRAGKVSPLYGEPFVEMVENYLRTGRWTRYYHPDARYPDGI